MIPPSLTYIAAAEALFFALAALFHLRAWSEPGQARYRDAAFVSFAAFALHFFRLSLVIVAGPMVGVIDR
jgi:hypothetical protein